MAQIKQMKSDMQHKLNKGRVTYYRSRSDEEDTGGGCNYMGKQDTGEKHWVINEGGKKAKGT